MKTFLEVPFYRNNYGLDWFPGLPDRCARLKQLGFSRTHQLVFVRYAERYRDSQTAGALQSRLAQQQRSQENIILNNELERVSFSYKIVAQSLVLICPVQVAFRSSSIHPYFIYFELRSTAFQWRCFFSTSFKDC